MSTSISNYIQTIQLNLKNIECIRLFLHNGDESGYDKNIKDLQQSVFYEL